VPDSPTQRVAVTLAFNGLTLSDYTELLALVSSVADDFAAVEAREDTETAYVAYTELTTQVVVQVPADRASDLSWLSAPLLDALDLAASTLVELADDTSGRRLQAVAGAAGRQLQSSMTISAVMDVVVNTAALFASALAAEATLQASSESPTVDTPFFTELNTGLAAVDPELDANAVSAPTTLSKIVVITQVSGSSVSALDEAVASVQSLIPSAAVVEASAQQAFPDQTFSVTQTVEVSSFNLPPSLPPPEPPSPSPQPPPPKSSGDGPPIVIIVVVVVVVVVVLIVVVIGVLYFRKHRKRRLGTATVIPDVGERVVVQPPPLPAAGPPAQVADAGGGGQFADRVS